MSQNDPLDGLDPSAILTSKRPRKAPQRFHDLKFLPGANNAYTVGRAFDKGHSVHVVLTPMATAAPAKDQIQKRTLNVNKYFDDLFGFDSETETECSDDEDEEWEPAAAAAAPAAAPAPAPTAPSAKRRRL